MKTATLYLDKKITLIVGGAVYTENMGSFESMISKFDSIILTGLAKPSKINKYKNLLLKNEFNERNIEWCNNAGFSDKNADVINFRIEFSK